MLTTQEKIILKIAHTVLSDYFSGDDSELAETYPDCFTDELVQEWGLTTTQNDFLKDLFTRPETIEFFTDNDWSCLEPLLNGVNTNV